ncbi:MAG: DUF5719 family protein [Humibacillus sp.]|nr:DUF5719 family protein [Humibacillus sp.]MDN5777044.1 DUF5719 family protein [Humibacillus sp.]
MKNVAGLVRVGSVALAVGAVVFGATRTSGSVQVAATHQRAGLATSSTVLVRSSTLVCPGPQRVGVKGLRDVSATVTASASAPPVDVLTDAGVHRPADATRGAVTLGVGAAPAAVTARERGKAAPVSLTKPQMVTAGATQGLAPGLAATQVWERRDGDDRGLAVTPCVPPSSDAWLVGGGGGPSRTERIIVGNPGANAVTVSFEVFGSTGPVASAQNRAVSIPPRSRAVVSLDALAPEEPSPSVHVVATGGVISAVLDDAWIDGATARGNDDATRSAAPSTDQVVAGLDVSGAAMVRLVNPGDTEALVQVRLLLPKGPSQPAELRAVRVPAGSTTDVALDLAAGPTGLHLTSDQPIVAGAYVERRRATGADRMGDFGWAPATRPVNGVAGLVLAGLSGSGNASSLLLAGGSRGGKVVVHVVTGGTDRALPTVVAPDSVVSIGLGSADQVWVSQDGGDVRAAVSVSGLASGVPRLSIAALTSAPLTALAIPVRQVAN